MKAAEGKQNHAQKRRDSDKLATGRPRDGTPQTWLDDFYSSSIAIPLSLVVLAAISLLSWKKRGHQIILALTLFLYARYLLWRGLYTLNTDDWACLLVSWTVYTAEAYAFVQIVLFAYHAWSPLERETVPCAAIGTSISSSRSSMNR